MPVCLFRISTLICLCVYIRRAQLAEYSSLCKIATLLYRFNTSHHFLDMFSTSSNLLQNQVGSSFTWWFFFYKGWTGLCYGIYITLVEHEMRFLHRKGNLVDNLYAVEYVIVHYACLWILCYWFINYILAFCLKGKLSFSFCNFCQKMSLLSIDRCSYQV